MNIDHVSVVHLKYILVGNTQLNNIQVEVVQENTDQLIIVQIKEVPHDNVPLNSDHVSKNPVNFPHKFDG